MKIAILGGSFNPIHIGHAMLADTVVKELGYDKVLFVPTFMPPHKEINGMATAQQRFEMVQRFCDSVPGNIFEAEDCEIRRGGISYTVDTVKYLTQKYDGVLSAKIALLMGEEIAAEFDKWKSPDEIAKFCDFIIFPRNEVAQNHHSCSFHNTPSGNYKGDFQVKFDKEKFKYPCTVLSEPILPVSSTNIRERISFGRSFEYLVPTAVFNYILEKGLYKNIHQ